MVPELKVMREAKVMTIISIDIIEEMNISLNEHAELTELSLSDIICAAIANYLEEEGYGNAEEYLTTKQRLKILESRYDELDAKIADIYRNLPTPEYDD